MIFHMIARLLLIYGLKLVLIPVTPNFTVPLVSATTLFPSTFITSSTLAPSRRSATETNAPAIRGCVKSCLKYINNHTKSTHAVCTLQAFVQDTLQRLTAFTERESNQQKFEEGRETDKSTQDYISLNNHHCVICDVNLHQRYYCTFRESCLERAGGSVEAWKSHPSFINMNTPSSFSTHQDGCLAPESNWLLMEIQRRPLAYPHTNLLSCRVFQYFPVLGAAT